MHIEISYLYRDSANYKQFESVVIAAPDYITPESLQQVLRQHFIKDQVWPDILHFRPEDLGWPSAYFEDHDEAGDDLGLHEVESIMVTEKPATADANLLLNRG